MLVVHKPPTAELVTEDEDAPTREAAEELAHMRAMVVATSDPAGREALLAEIQERFGNEAARETIARLRAAAGDEA
jgi:hypothetical protein